MLTPMSQNGPMRIDGLIFNHERNVREFIVIDQRSNLRCISGSHGYSIDCSSSAETVIVRFNESRRVLVIRCHTNHAIILEFFHQLRYRKLSTRTVTKFSVVTVSPSKHSSIGIKSDRVRPTTSNLRDKYILQGLNERRLDFVHSIRMA